ncbi:cobalamin-dependent protein [Roseovarius salis]|uniref:cobalamin B12-binding domain-containing protein n=1 Tax=Roseovarius salis TaxID=3376063 RepID=UPI0037CC1506
MKTQYDVVLDQGVFSETSGLFARKRDRLPEAALEQLAREVMIHAARLSAASPQRPFSAPAERLDTFCDHLLKDDADGALALLQKEMRGGLSTRDVCLGYISGAARRLGDMWEADLVSFVQVTTASGYLYGLIRALRPETPDTAQPAPDTKNALFATVPGEDHSLGVTVAAEVFRDAGWDIDLCTGMGHNELVARISDTAPAIVGISVGGSGRMEALSTLCVSIRLIAPGALIVVAGAGTEGSTDISEIADVDFVFSDVESAESQLARLMHLRGWR